MDLTSKYPAIPYVQSPCKMGRSKPALAPAAGSTWIGLRSPLSRYSNAQFTPVLSSSITSKDCSGAGGRGGGAAPKLPQPPSPRRNKVDETVHRGCPELASLIAFSK